MAEGRSRLAILISGRGSNMEAIVTAARNPAYPAEVVLVVSNRGSAQGLQRAAELGIPTLVLPHRDYPTREAFDAALDEQLAAHVIEFVVLAGFMRVLTPAFVRRWKGRILNIHPSLLPRYPGLDTHARALAAGDTEAGCTVHEVTEDLDSGPILAQARVPIRPGETPETLAARVLAEENRLYPRAIADFIRGREA
jgi:formyltetrahydrofolate-dependent phosphoribosylglycinamide formyltransferase